MTGIMSGIWDELCENLSEVVSEYWVTSAENTKGLKASDMGSVYYTFLYSVTSHDYKPNQLKIPYIALNLKNPKKSDWKWCFNYKIMTSS